MTHLHTVAALLLLLGAALTLLGTLGLLRFKGFYQRIHAPTLGGTAGTFCIVVAYALVYGPAHPGSIGYVLVICLFLLITTPISLMLVLRAAIHRDRRRGFPTAPQHGIEDDDTVD